MGAAVPRAALRSRPFILTFVTERLRTALSFGDTTRPYKHINSPISTDSFVRSAETWTDPCDLCPEKHRSRGSSRLTPTGLEAWPPFLFFSLFVMTASLEPSDVPKLTSFHGEEGRSERGSDNHY